MANQTKVGKGKMSTIFVENNGNTQRAYNSLLVKPKDLSSLCSDLPLKMISELAKEPLCAMDLARHLEQHEQKIYYHLRRLEESGIIRMTGTEKRYGMTAKMYSVVSPVIATKLYNDGYSLNPQSAIDPATAKFLEPFVQNGHLNAKIIIGDHYPHGEYNEGGLDAGYVADLTLFLGNFVREIKSPCYKLDTQMKESELKENLIVVGGPKYNTITHHLNKDRLLPIHFDEKKDFHIFSKISEKEYTDNVSGLVVRLPNPFNKEKQMLVFAGRRPKGTAAAIMAFTKHLDVFMKGNSSDGSKIANVVVGLDKSGDGAIDSVEFKE